MILTERDYLTMAGSLVIPECPDAQRHTVLCASYDSSQHHTIPASSSSFASMKVTFHTKYILQMVQRDRLKQLYKDVYNAHLFNMDAVAAMYKTGFIMPHDKKLASSWSAFAVLTRSKDSPDFDELLAIFKKHILDVLVQKGEYVVSSSLYEKHKLLRSSLNCKQVTIDKVPELAKRLRQKLGQDATLCLTPTIAGVGVALVYTLKQGVYCLRNVYTNTGGSISLQHILALGVVPTCLPRQYTARLTSLEGHSHDSVVITGTLTVPRSKFRVFKKHYPKKTTIIESVGNYLTDINLHKNKHSEFLVFVADAIFKHQQDTDKFSYISVKKHVMTTHIQSLGFRVAEIPDFFRRILQVRILSTREFRSRFNDTVRSDYLIKGMYVLPACTKTMSTIPRVNIIYDS